MNESDSERIASFFDSQGFQETQEIKKADLVIFNTCGVRQTAEDRVYGQVHNIRKASPNVKIIITGCIAHRKDVQRRLKDKVDLFISIKDIKKIPVELSFLQDPASLTFGEQKYNTQKNSDCNDYLNITPKYANKESAFIPIMTGCNNFCSYCVVPYARGREYSRPVEEIFKEIKNLYKKGYKEITLLGQNINSYCYENSNSKLTTRKNSKTPNYKLHITNYNKKVTFPTLLNSIAKSFPNIKFHFLTSHPKDFSEKLMNVVAKNNNISKEIHLPIQSGSDKILKAMNRPYTQKHYLKLIKKAQEIIPRVTFTTDVIIGFPGETEEDFQETVKVFEKVNYTKAYLNKYSPRPETVAEKLGDPIEWNEKKRRAKFLRQFVKNKKE